MFCDSTKLPAVAQLSRRRVQKSPAVAREDALQLIQFLLQDWSSVDDFHTSSERAYVISIEINGNLGSILHCLATIARIDF